MKLSELIAHCDTCRNYARKVDPINWQDLFQQAWLKVREHELRDPSFTAKYHKTYFYTVLNSVKLDRIRKEGRSPIVKAEPPEGIDENIDDAWSLEMTILNDWLNQETEDEYIQFLKDITELSIMHKTKEEAAKSAGMSKRTFFKYLAEARKEIDYEHFKITDCHPFVESDLVRLSTVGSVVQS